LLGPGHIGSFQSPSDLRFVQIVEQYNISTVLRFVQTVSYLKF